MKTLKEKIEKILIDFEYNTHFQDKMTAIKGIKNEALDEILSLISQDREELAKELEKIKEWPEPQAGAGEGLGVLAGTGMYLQYDHDRKKHKEQIDQVLSLIKNQVNP